MAASSQGSCICRGQLWSVSKIQLKLFFLVVMLVYQPGVEMSKVLKKNKKTQQWKVSAAATVCTSILYFFLSCSCASLIPGTPPPPCSPTPIFQPTSQWNQHLTNMLSSTSSNMQLWFWRTAQEYICFGWKLISVGSPEANTPANRYNRGTID